MRGAETETITENNRGRVARSLPMVNDEKETVSRAAVMTVTMAAFAALLNRGVSVWATRQQMQRSTPRRLSSVAQRLGDMDAPHSLTPRQIGNRPRHAQDAGVAARR